MTKTTVCRCPECGSTEAYCDESKSIVDLSYMTCPACGNAGHNDSWQVAEDWLVDIDLPEGQPIPPTLPGLKDGEYFHQQLAKVREEREEREAKEREAKEREAKAARTRWRVMGRDTFAREDYIAGEFATEAEAKQRVAELEARHAATQDEAMRDQVWITEVEK